MQKLQNYLNNEMKSLKEQNLFGELPIFSTQSSNTVKLNGEEVIMLSSNNYLGFANHPRLKKAAIQAIQKWGYGTSAVRQIAGTMEIHMQLEQTLSEYKESEETLVFNAGISANRGTIQAIMTEKDAIISDELNHGSIIDGIRLTKSEKKIFPHKNTEGLRKALQETKNAEKTLIVTDGVFSMEGDIAPLKEITELAEEFDAIIMVDDAHGDGVLGQQGKGTIDYCKVKGKIAIEMGTLSKAFGSLGGYIAGSKELKEYLINKARSFIFTTTHPPAIAAATIESIKLIQEEPKHLENLWKNTKYFKENLKSLGFDLGNTETPIIPVIVGESKKAQQLSKELLQEKIFVKPIMFPLVAKNKARVRNIVNAHHTKKDLDKAITAYEKVGKKLKII